MSLFKPTKEENLLSTSPVVTVPQDNSPAPEPEEVLEYIPVEPVVEAVTPIRSSPEVEPEPVTFIPPVIEEEEVSVAEPVVSVIEPSFEDESKPIVETPESILAKIRTAGKIQNNVPPTKLQESKAQEPVRQFLPPEVLEVPNEPAIPPLYAEPKVSSIPSFIPPAEPVIAKIILEERPKTKDGIKSKGFLGGFMKPVTREELEEKKRRFEELQTEKKAGESLVDVDRTYREGLTTLKDLLAPASLKFQSSHFELNGKFARSFFVLAYPRFLSSNWLSFIINAEGALDVSIFIYPIDSETILKKLKSKVGEIGSQMAINQEKGMVRDPMLETAYKDVESLRDDLMQGTEKYFRVALYFTLYASDLKELDTNSATLESALGSKLIVTKRALMQTQGGFNSTLPLGLDELDIANNMNTSPLSTTFPFVSSDLTSNDGILYGINRHNNSLILFDRFAMENANSVVFAKSGAGKSYAVKLEILRWLMVGAEVIVIDPENEYKHLADAVGGTYLNVSLNSDSRINPFDLPVAIEGEDAADVLRSAVVNLLGLFSLMLGKLSPTEEAFMDKALWQTYAKKDITEKSDFKTVEYPTMNDLIEILNGMVGAESLAQRLSKYTDGTFAGLFNQPTNIVLNNQLVVFSIRDLEDQLRPIAMYIVLGHIWNTVRSELKKRILVIDEAWIMMQHEDSARFLFGMAKRARKYYLGVTTITQDVADFMASPYGKPIVTNSSIQLLLKQSPAAINIIAETFFLTEGEKYLLLESEVGEGIFFAGLKHAAIKIYASYVEDQIITTDPKQLLQIEESEKEGE
jgi:conjugal transfer ATP-binding protein TraC